MAAERDDTLVTIEQMRRNAAAAAAAGGLDDSARLNEDADAVEQLILGEGRAAPPGALDLERQVLADIRTLIRERAISPCPAGSIPADPARADPSLCVSTSERERIENYVRTDADGKRALLDEWRDYQRSGRYPLAQAAEALEGATGARYESMLQELLAGAAPAVETR
jgi:hypothetical protein